MVIPRVRLIGRIMLGKGAYKSTRRVSTAIGEGLNRRCRHIEIEASLGLAVTDVNNSIAKSRHSNLQLIVPVLHRIHNGGKESHDRSKARPLRHGRNKCVNPLAVLPNCW